MGKIELSGKGGILQFVAKKRSFGYDCCLYIKTEDNVIDFGLNDLEELISNFLKAFSILIPKSYAKDGSGFEPGSYLVSCLMGPHCIIGAKVIDESCLELRFYRSENEILPTILLTSNDIKNWIEELTRFLIRLPYDFKK